MCLHVLMVGSTSCLDRVVHAFPVADALPQSLRVWTSFTRILETAWSNMFDENV